MIQGRICPPLGGRFPEPRPGMLRASWVGWLALTYVGNMRVKFYLIKIHVPGVGGKNVLKTVRISQGGRRGRRRAGRVLNAYRYIPKYMPKRAKWLRVAIARNREICDFDPPRWGGQKPHEKLCKKTWDGWIPFIYVSRIDIYNI